MDDYSLVAALALNTQFKPQQDAQIAICIYSPLTGLVHSHLSSRPAFLYYDHLLTLDEEIKFIWSRPYHSSSWLFFLNRYFSFVGNIVIFLSMFFALSVILGNNLTILSCAACSFNSVVSMGWELVLFYDTLLFSMTLLKAYQARFQPQIKEFNKLSLFRIIVQDGSIYFGIMVLTNFTNVLTFYVSGSTLLRGTLSPFASCTSVTLMSHLMLHLHKIANKGLYVCHSDTIAQTANSFTPDATVSAISFGPRDVSSLQES
ncbi:hypothetical protein F5880DRAFT_1673758 [Lentinula raphanica]|nr:hypothetical protein F5880DRAFT_1673758 [Lentinula raphanica]